MKNFIIVALPWVAFIITIVIYAVKLPRKGEKKTNENYMTSGSIIGTFVGIGVSLSFKDMLGFNAFFYGIGFGFLIGTVIGMIIKR